MVSNLNDKKINQNLLNLKKLHFKGEKYFNDTVYFR